MGHPPCTVCGHESLERNVSFGEQPLSTRLTVTSGAADTPRWPLSLGHCRRCFTIQLADRFAPATLARKYPQVRFREPVAHLPQVVATLKAIGAIAPGARVGVLSYIDQDLTRLLEADSDLAPIQVSNFHAPGLQRDAGLETLQARVCDPAAVDEWARVQGPMDLVSARFLLEHAESAAAFLKSLVRAVKPGGHLLVEVPDVAKTLAFGNHALVWEDHFTYFTPASLRTLASLAGCSVASLESHPYPYEDALVLVLKIGPAAAGDIAPSQAEPPSPREALEAFGASFGAARASLREELQARRASGQTIAVFGAGHHAAKYINFHGIAPWLDFVADDDPVKIGLYVAGTSLMVRPSSELRSRGTSLCLSSLSPPVQARVEAAMPEYFVQGGKFRPIFNTSAESP